ncbi:hypothetical protein GSI_09461 [Ganoderma sinense ZZ0214-1]|uniref:CxC1-like cysteine cluster associated with KDZ transposases domain-containing protein n=1 Tax=Ganoderma sinense ZZ0214-1 TaxID=1077348 RepID=A0A2G8S6K5_9APHY|nr:hypothetical protein GSI_09461 [Ganoderma sinense ZZ0214-1]
MFFGSLDRSSPRHVFRLPWRSLWYVPRLPAALPPLRVVVATATNIVPSTGHHYALRKDQWLDSASALAYVLFIMRGQKRKTKSSISSAVDIHVPAGQLGIRTTKQTLRLSQQSQRRKEAKRQRFDLLSGLSFADREAWADLNGDEDHSDDEFHALHTLPPGEEGMFLSHEGGEDELCQSLFEETKRKRVDGRLRHDRTERQNMQWQIHRDDLIHAYLEWQAGLCPDETDLEDALPPFEMVLVDFFDTSKQTFRRTSPTEPVNIVLAREGYLGTSPIAPTVAVAFQTLEAYRQLHRVCPRLSLQAQVPYQRSLVDQFSIAYDEYLEILAGVDSRVHGVLKQDGKNHRMLNVCAPCLYTLEDEPKLTYSLLVTIDGNQSLKLVDSKFRGGTPHLDSRWIPADLFISEEEVDLYKDEVNAKRGSAVSGGDRAIENADVNSDESKVADPISVCEERWRNAGPETRKKMFALFMVSSVFVCLCCHGHILVMCDMIRSGELMKYPLAIIAKLIDVYGENIVVGYDIGCKFRKTVSTSPLLSNKAAAAAIEFVVPAFHGHSHNRKCQVKHLPLYVKGAGKEDFEGHQSIAQFVTFWSHTKHAESGNFIFQNYKQALEIIQNDGTAFAELSARLKITDCEAYLRQEREYLEKRKREPKEVTTRIEYIQALLAYETAGSNATAAQKAVDSADSIIDTRNAHAAQKQEQALKQLRIRVKASFTRWQTAQARVLQLEDELHLSEEERWKPGSKEYDEAFSELTHCQYHLALDNLERLVVQRLFELTKLGMSGLGYKLREKIGKALKTRADAIKTALNEYNRCAAKLRRPALSWNEVMDMITLAEFDLLCETREDIRQFPWAQLVNRQAMNLYFNVQRAKEEIQRLNVEIPRLFTFLLDRHYDYQIAIAAVRESDPALARELHTWWTYADRISGKITSRLFEALQLARFLGRVAAEKRVGRCMDDTEGIGLPSWACHAPVAQAGSADQQDLDTHLDAMEGMGLSGIDDEGDAGHFVDFLDRLGED